MAMGFLKPASPERSPRLAGAGMGILPQFFGVGRHVPGSPPARGVAGGLEPIQQQLHQQERPWLVAIEISYLCGDRSGCFSFGLYAGCCRPQHPVARAMHPPPGAHCRDHPDPSTRAETLFGEIHSSAAAAAVAGCGCRDHRPTPLHQGVWHQAHTGGGAGDQNGAGRDIKEARNA